MKAVEITSPGVVNVVDLEMPVAGPGEVLVKICYVGFCGSDLNTYRGGNLLAISPVIPGHEIGGTVAAVGEEEITAPATDNTVMIAEFLSILPKFSAG